MDFTPIPQHDVAAAYRSFSDRLKEGRLFPKRTLTWRPNKRIRNVYWHAKQAFWASPNAQDRWCPFGITEPAGKVLRMTCQFNPPGRENDRSHGAVFLRDTQG